MPPLWLALHLPQLPIEALAPLPPPSAVVAQQRVVIGDALARQAGVRCGVGAAAARALCPGIALFARDAARETAALQALACWAGRLTPRIVLASATLLLDIGACLRLFGGWKNLRDAAVAGLVAQGFEAVSATAATPLAAEWLARQRVMAGDRAGEDDHAVDACLSRALDALPVEVLPEATAQALRAFGVDCLGAARRLPSAALARRIGAQAVQDMARAYGEWPDPRADFVFPEKFVLPLALPAPVEDAGALLFAARRLAAALSGWLAVRQAGVREALLRLQYRQGEMCLALQFAVATADAARFERVLRERLERTTLAAPVETLCLEAACIEALPGRSRSLLGGVGEAGDDDAFAALCERLSARLGAARVFRIAPLAGHRPECATRRLPPWEAAVSPALPHGPRPLWLLESPEALDEVDGRPVRRGPLRLLAGPERIESGWWDGGEGVGDLRRDYFTALSAQGAWLWIYRDCGAGGWFLHGWFA